MLQQTNGPAFLCASSINIGDALAKLQRLQQQADDRKATFLNAARLLRQDVLECKRQHKDDEISISHECALNMIPTSMFNFCCAMLDGEVEKLTTQLERVTVDKSIEEQAVQNVVEYSVGYRLSSPHHRTHIATQSSTTNATLYVFSMERRGPNHWKAFPA